MISVETQKKINQLLPLVTAEKLERWMEWTLAGVIPPTFKPELTPEEGRYTENAIVKKESSYTDGKYSLSIWRVQNCHEKNVSLSLQGILEEDEVYKLQDTRLSRFGETKLVIIKKRKVNQNDQENYQ